MYAYKNDNIIIKTMQVSNVMSTQLLFGSYTYPVTSVRKSRLAIIKKKNVIETVYCEHIYLYYYIHSYL